MNQKVVKMDSNRNNRLSILLILIVFVYIMISIFSYFTQKHIEAFQVKMGSLSSNNIYTGLALRDEEIITAERAGYINYYAREGERVGVGNMVYTLDESGKLSEYLNSETKSTLSELDMSELKTEIVGFINTFDPASFNSVYDFKYDVQGTVLKLANSNILDNIDKINSSGMADLISFCYAPQTGIAIYSIDGFENTLLTDVTEEMFNQKQYEKEQLISNDLVAAGAPVYKVSKSEDWTIVINPEPDKAKELMEDADQVVKVKFLKNQNISWANISSYTSPEGKTYIGLTFSNSMITFCTDRFIEIELILEDETGLKIPNSSIVQREFFIVPERFLTKGGNSNNDGVLRRTYLEDGTPSVEFIETTIYSEIESRSISQTKDFYLDDSQLRPGDTLLAPDSNEQFTVAQKGTLTGVFNINKGYADFKEINILYQNDEYSIVKSNTQYGLSVYDYIVLDSQTVTTDELLYE